MNVAITGQSYGYNATRPQAANTGSPAPAQGESYTPGSAEDAPSAGKMLAFRAATTVHENRGWLAIGSGVAGVVATALTGDPVWTIVGAGAALGFSQM